MALLTKYTCPAVPGSETESKHPYSVAVIGRFDYAFYLRTAENNYTEPKLHAALLERRWRNAEANLKAGHGNLASVYGIDGHMCVNNRAGSTHVVSQTDIDFATALHKMYPNLLAYVESELGRAYSALMSARSLVAHGNKELQVLRWSNNVETAKRAMRSFKHSHTDLQVVPVKAVGTRNTEE